MLVPSSGTSRYVGLLDLRHHDAALEEYGRRHHQDGRVHQQGAVERHHRIDQVVAAGRPLFGGRVADVAGLHQRGVQVQVVRHHGRSQHSDGHVQGVAVEARDQSGHHLGNRGPGPDDLDAEAGGDHRDQRQHEGFEGADAEALKPQQQKRIGGRQQDARQQRNVEQQVEPDGRAQHLRQVAGRDGDLAQRPQRQVDAPRVGLAAGLRQVAPRHDPQPRAEGLEQDGHGVGHHQHPQKPVSETRSAFEIGGPVARVHVPDAHQVGRPGEGEHALPEGHLGGAHRRVNVGQGAGIGAKTRDVHELNYS